MPYKISGKDVFHKVGTSWKLKEHTRSHKNAIKAVRFLYGLEHGMKRRK